MSRPSPTGLINTGNTCFMNSVLQCLTYTKPLQKFFKNSHSDTCKKGGFCPVCALEIHMKKSLNSKKPFIPKQFVLNLRKIAKHFRQGRQEDSHEFLRFLVDGMHDILKIDKKSPIQDIFGGSFQSQVVCLDCKNQSNTFDPIMDISLDIKNCDSIEQALYQYTRTEDLKRDNQYKCEKCNRLRDAKKRITIKSSPKVLTIQLKRFGFYSYKGSKVSRHIKYPEVLKLNPFVSDGKDEKYHLYGVLVHAGHTCNSGHYYAYIKSGLNWYRMDDESTQPVPIKAVLSQSAYLLFYQKESNDSTEEKKPKHAKKIEVTDDGKRKERLNSNEIVENGTVSQEKKKVAVSVDMNGDTPKAKQSFVNVIVKNGHKEKKLAEKELDTSKHTLLTEDLVRKSIKNGIKIEKTIEFVLESANVAEKSVPVTPVESKKVASINSTAKWMATPLISKKSSASVSEINSTFSFTARPAVKKLADFVAQLEGIDTPAVDKVSFESVKEQESNHINSPLSFMEINGHVEPKGMKQSKEMNGHNQLKESKKSQNRSHTVVTASTSADDGIDFRTALQNQMSKAQILPWNHMATSDLVFQRNQMMKQYEKDSKRKRPTRDDMEYEAPLLKGLKKKQKKQQQQQMQRAY